MAKLDSDSADALRKGVQGEDANPFFYSSTLWEAWEFGRFIRDHLPPGANRVLSIQKRRGSVWEANGAQFKLNYKPPHRWEVC